METKFLILTVVTQAILLGVAFFLWGDKIKVHAKSFKIWHYLFSFLFSTVFYLIMHTQVSKYLSGQSFPWFNPFLASGALIMGFGLVFFYKINWPNIKNDLGIK